MTILKALLLILIGLSGGLAVGAGLVAFLTVLGIVPRLAQITKTHAFIHLYQSGIIAGAVFWSWIGLREAELYLVKDVVLVYGLLAGMFVGLLAAALTEVLNVLPILAKRIHMVDKLVWLLMAMVLGKVLGSLFHWMFFAPFS
ncbi:stage V sporulation protein AB [Caldalkalibacillus uzonensis]|uniref:Stage V sporulation protein AB n=1 Tax=Caldalkalibacillus uzonensis TaxID=353224 RepID=A0ABU0CVU3_9BACI|nr:stage V sporulation protein AB [Caldalkalibacillus uzonensis]MDQ0339167.1 stage V sporulation protein AB [Caldalkalibacillus uzonensis]